MRQLKQFWNGQAKTLTAGVGASNEAYDTLNTSGVSGGSVGFYITSWTDNSGASAGTLTLYFEATYDQQKWHPVRVLVWSGSAWTETTSLQIATADVGTPSDSSPYIVPTVIVPDFAGIQFRVRVVVSQVDATFYAFATALPAPS